MFASNADSVAIKFHVPTGARPGAEMLRRRRRRDGAACLAEPTTIAGVIGAAR